MTLPLLHRAKRLAAPTQRLLEPRAPSPRSLGPRALAALALAATLSLPACKSDEPSYAGSYRTTWGSSVLTQEGRMIIGTYPRGTLRCRSEPPKLLCDWKEGTATGKATLTREPTHKTLQGTWGRNESDSDGGAWLFTPIPK